MFSKKLLLPVILLSAMVFFTACRQNPTEDQNGKTTQKDSLGMQDVISKMETDKQNVPSERLTYTVSLGVMPDMNHTGEGMLIGLVNDGQVGFRAGLQKGDIVLEMGGQKVTDLVSYTKILGTFKKGDQTTLVIRRDDQLMNVLVEF